MNLLVVSLCAAFALGYWIGKTRSLDRRPREIYDRDGRRIF